MSFEFNVAAKATKADKVRKQKAREKDSDYIEVPIDGVTYRAYRPDPAKVTVLFAASGREAPRLIFLMIEDMMGEEASRHIRQLMWDDRITLNDLFFGTEQNPTGLLMGLFEEFGGRPTEPSTASADTQSSGGRKSTGRARGKGSIPSDSDSTGS